MIRRCFSWMALAACVGTGTLLAAERVTFILNDGERIGGAVVFRGGFNTRDRDDRDRGDLSLLTDDGRIIPIRLDQVAVIEFGGGRPTPAELEALSYDNLQMIVLRNGTVELGRLIGLADGDRVRWQGRSGRQEMIPFRNLTRVYLDSDRARAAFNDGGRSRRGRDDRDPRFGNRNDRDFEGPDNRNPFTRGAGGIRVQANQPWTSTGIQVRAGDLVVFRASGRIAFGEGAAATAGPDGNNTQRTGGNPVDVMPVGGLIGRVGNSLPFPIGSNSQPIRMPDNGVLLLGVNDGNLGDNGGFFTVEIVEDRGDGGNRDISVPGGRRGHEVRVEANRPWTSTGLNVRAGDFVAFRAVGTISFGRGGGNSAGPDGNDRERSRSSPVGVMPVGGLIGRVGNSVPFPIGSNPQPIRMPANGTLLLGVNDNNVGDNSGFFSVEITPR